MYTLIESLNGHAAPWMNVMASVLWQSALLAAGVAAVCWAFRRQSPALRYWIWLALAGKLLLLPLWSIDVPLPAMQSPPASPAVSSPPDATVAWSPALAELPPPSAATAPRSIQSRPSLQWFEAVTWQAWLLSIWALVVVGKVGRTAWQYFRLRAVLVHAAVADGAVIDLVRECSHILGLRTPPAVKQTDVDGSPLVCGLVRPVMLLPESHAERFDKPALRQVVLHELAHLRRFDLLTILVFYAMRVLYWFHPAAYWIVYRAGLERELACDQLAMRHSGASPAAYARTLINAAGRSSQPMALTAAGAARLDGGYDL